MPKYDLPPLPKPEKDEEMVENMPTTGMSSSPKSPDKWQRTISLPVNDAILESIKVGDNVSVTLMGEVHGTENSETSEDDYGNNKSIRVMVTSIEAYPEDMDAIEEEDSMMAGYEEG
tara:strand:- start:313 stop:663 length:351 start_codon:yes stop_codon:yes gene_type:complete